MKKIIFFVLLFVFPVILSHAQTSAPRMINFQGVLVDEGGNVLYDIQQADIRCSVVDGAGTVLYEEIQPDTTLVSGAISILCGNGVDPNTGASTGGIPYNVFSPDGSRLLRVQVNDSIPQEEVEIVSVPYSYYSQLTLGLANPLEADDITAGVITRTHLHDDLWNDIVELGFGEGALDAHRIEMRAHPTTSIYVEESNFSHASGRNLQQILQGLDVAIEIRRNQDEVLGIRIDDEAADREAEDLAIRGDLSAHTGATTAHGSDGAVVGARTLSTGLATKVSKGGDTMTGNLTMSNSNIIMSATKTVDGVDVSTLPGVINSKVSKSGDTMTGDLSINDTSCNALVGRNCLVDGVDVSTLPGSIDSKVSKSGDTMTGDLNVQTKVIIGETVQSGRYTLSGAFGLWERSAASDNGYTRINYRGYDDGTAYHRNLLVGDGKQTTVFSVDGDSGDVRVNTGELYVNDINPPTTGSGVGGGIISADESVTAGSLAKLWIRAICPSVNGPCTIHDSYNVAQAATNGTGAINIEIDKDFANNNYACIGTESLPIARSINIVQINRSPGLIVVSLSHGHTLDLFCFGRLSF